jgi:hypothetical protein
MKLVAEDLRPSKDPDARRVRQRDHRGRGDGGLDERRAAPAGDRARGGRRADDRRLRRIAAKTPTLADW